MSQDADKTALLTKAIQEAFALGQEALDLGSKTSVRAILEAQTAILRDAIVSVRGIAPTSTAKLGTHRVIQWIKPEEQMPDDCETVLLATDDGDLDSGFYLSEANEWSWQTGHRIDETVLSWAKLPEPPTS